MLFKSNFFLSLLFLFLTVQSLCFAAMLSGKVSSFDPTTRKLSLSTDDPVSGKKNQSEIWINNDAVFEGISGIADIQSGETLWVEADSDSEGNLRASKIAKA